MFRNRLTLIAFTILMCCLTGCQSTAPAGENATTASEPSAPTEPPAPVVDEPVDPSPDPDQFLVEAATIVDSRLPEISGLAVSGVDDSRLFAVNDSGQDPLLFSLDREGRVTEEYAVSLPMRDWEALTAFTDNGESWLMLADTGDNLGVFTEYRLYFFDEPDAPASVTGPLEPAATLRFRYPDGSRNSEAVAVDMTNRLIILITKSRPERRIYSLPLQLETSIDPAIATFIGTLADIPKTTLDMITAGLTGVDLSMVTELEIDQSGNAWALTYRGVYRWRLEAGNDWGSAFSAPPDLVTRHTLTQAEAMGLSPSSNTLIFTSERLPAPIVELNTSAWLSR